MLWDEYIAVALKIPYHGSLHVSFQISFIGEILRRETCLLNLKLSIWSFMQQRSFIIWPILFQIFEWWYFKKYGTSFIEQVSLNHISPLLGGPDSTAEGNNSSGSSNGSSPSNGSASNGSIENRNGSTGQQSTLPGQSSS